MFLLSDSPHRGVDLKRTPEMLLNIVNTLIQSSAAALLPTQEPAVLFEHHCAPTNNFDFISNIAFESVVLSIQIFILFTHTLCTVQVLVLI